MENCVEALLQMQLDEQAEVVVTDPQALGNAKMDLAGLEGLTHYSDDPYEAAKGCHAIALLTEWDLYRNLDY